MRRAGLGDRLMCLGGAWLFARNTGRILVVDWRFGAYSTGSNRNIFERCFEITPRLADVLPIADDLIDPASAPHPRYPWLWNT